VALPPLVEPGPDLTPHEVQRYARHLALAAVGREGQRRLKNARVVVIGAGGLGSPVLLYLAAAGIGTIGVVDCDAVDVSNLQRQIVHATPDVGRAKTTSARDAITRLNPLVEVRVHDLRLGSATAVETLRGYDLVIDGSDNFSTRYLVSDACAVLDLPLVWGSISGFDGQASVFWTAPPAGHGYVGVSYRDVFPDPPAPGTVPSCAEGGVLGVLCGAIGSVLANEAVKLVAGIGDPLLGRLLTFDALTARWREIPVRPDPGRVAARPLADLAAASAPGRVISASRLAERLASRARGRDDFDLVDVREPHEHDQVAIPGARLIPRGQFLDGTAFASLDPARPLILHCASGARSAEALEIAAARGFDVVHLEGGILAWPR